MAEEWKRSEILLEAIRGDIKVLAEGHAALDRKVDTKIDALREDLGGQISDLKSVVKSHSQDIKDLKIDVKDIKTDVKEMKADLKEVKKDLHEHVRQPANLAHAAV